MTVFPHAEPNSAAALTRSTTTEPPFVVVGTCDRPFLARVELLFAPIHNSSDDGQKVTVEHWIEVCVVHDGLGTQNTLIFNFYFSWIYYARWLLYVEKNKY